MPVLDSGQLASVSWAPVPAPAFGFITRDFDGDSGDSTFHTPFFLGTAEHVLGLLFSKAWHAHGRRNPHMQVVYEYACMEVFKIMSGTRITYRNNKPVVIGLGDGQVTDVPLALIAKRMRGAHEGAIEMVEHSQGVDMARWSFETSRLPKGPWEGSSSDSDANQVE